MNVKVRDNIVEYKSNVIRVPKDILDKLREIMPELRDENEANLVRVALRKFIYDTAESARKLPPEQAEKIFKLLEDYTQKKVADAQIGKSGN